MFTGIVEEIGTVVAVERGSGDARLVLSGPTVTPGTLIGESIAVDGVCLTVTSSADGCFGVDVMPESLACTTLGTLGVGSAVNLERAMRADGRLDGHLVQGHVDGTGILLSRDPGARWDDLVIGIPGSLARYVAHKGSITVSGVSLTVTTVTSASFGVSLIPTTLAATTLGRLAVGDQVNLEVDVIAKYVERLLGLKADGHGTAARAASSAALEPTDGATGVTA